MTEEQAPETDEQNFDQATVEEVGEEAGDEAIERLTQERDKLQDQLLRTLADLQNVRRRAQQEKQQLQQFATEVMVRDLLPILDNFERTVAAAEQGANRDSLLEGVKIIERQLRNVLETQQVRRIEAKGKPFDPELHDAIGHEPSELPEGTVSTEVEPGYQMGERVIRPAKVRVAAKP
jgi:molecular chaperone GrpE